MTQRHDGWTAPRKQAFLEALTQYGSVQKAAHAVGMSPSSAYRARLRDDQAFRDAWAVAVEVTVRTLHESAVERAIHGTVNPVFYKGEIVGERVVHDSRLLIFMLRMHAPDIFDVPGGVSLVDAPEPEPKPDPRAAFNAKLDAMRDKMLATDS